MRPEEPAVALGEAIRTAMAARGFSQKEVARRLEISESTVSRLVNKGALKTVHDTLKRLRALEAVLSLPAGRLVGLLDSVGERGATEHAIRRDSSLPEDVKDAMVAILDHFSGADASVTRIGARRVPAEATKRAAAAETGDPPELPPKQQAKLDEHIVKRTPGKRKGKDGPKA